MYGYTHDKDNYIKRLRRIEGQIRGLQRMVEEDKYCIDILTQVAAATKALQSVALGLLEEHLGHCVVQAVAEGGDTASDKVKEASDAIARLVLVLTVCLSPVAFSQVRMSFSRSGSGAPSRIRTCAHGSGGSSPAQRTQGAYQRQHRRSAVSWRHRFRTCSGSCCELLSGRRDGTTCPAGSNDKA